MDLYTTAFNIPRSAGSTASYAHDNSAPSPALSTLDFARADPPAPPARSASQLHLAEAPTTGKIGSMRSRFSPSVKAFMPSAFGGKRGGDRIAEVTALGAEKADGEGADAGNVQSPSSAWHDGRAPPVLEEGQSVSAAMAAIKNRDSRSTVGTRSSLDFSSAASFSADSTAPSTTGGDRSLGHDKRDSLPGQAGHRSQSEPPSASHSASASISAIGPNASQSSADLAEAMQRLSVDVMANHQCLVTFTPIQSDENQTSDALVQAFPRQGSYPQYPGPGQLPFPTNGLPPPGYPYQQYHPQTYGQDGSSGFGSGLFGTGLIGAPGLPSPIGTIGSAKGQQPQQQEQAKPKSPQFNFHLSGGYQQVMSARGALLRENPFRTRSAVKVPRADVLDSAPGSPPGTEALKPDVRRRLDDIALATRAHIAIMSTEAHGADLGYGLETERNVELVISGPFESVEQARVRLLVLLDELSGLHSDTCEIDYKLHNIIGGRKRCVIQTIQEETATNIYFPTPFSGVLGSNRNPTVLAKQNTVHITGEFFGVQRARDMLFQVSMHKSKCIISRDTAILPRKLDWMLSERLEDLRTVMHDNGTFINFPVIGSQASLISVYGDNRVNIERTIRSVMQLACQFYVASFWLLPVSFDVFMSAATLNPSQMTPVLKHISNASGAEVVLKSNCFEIHGLETEVRSAVTLILELEIVKSFHHEIRFQIELANEHREFISGKKNGKINKIMKSANVKIKFETFNDYNFLIDVAGSDLGAIQGLSMLQEELPAEVSFHVPEAYHKRIIGVGGKNIQRIMKKYGVYVKFSNAEEFAALGGYEDNEDNVIARTPAKNAINLENLKQSVMELVNPKDKDYTVETVSIARRYHRTLLGEKGIFIHDIESKTSSTVRFPPKETASDVVTIFGPESQIHIAAQMLLDHVPFEAELRTPYSHDLAQLVMTHEFVALTERVKRDLNIIIVPLVRQAQSGEAVFKLRLNRSNTDFLPTAKDLLEDFLVSRNVQVYASPVRARSDSFASSFPHFATKLISTAAAESTDSFPEAARYNERRLRAANSTPDIKALFDSPAHSTHNYTTSSTASPLATSSLYPSPYHESRSSDLWGAPRQMSSTGIHFPQHSTRLSDDVNIFQRNNDTLGVEERIRALRKPRSFAHRAHSLDIGALSAQQAAQAAASRAQQYGTVCSGYSGGHAANPSISRLGPSGAQVIEGDTVDEVSRVLAQLAFDRT